MEPITRFGLEFNPFLKNAKDIPINTQESREAAFRLDYLAKNKGLASLPALRKRQDHGSPQMESIPEPFLVQSHLFQPFYAHRKRFLQKPCRKTRCAAFLPQAGQFQVHTG